MQWWCNCFLIIQLQSCIIKAKPTCAGRRSKQNIPNGKHCISLSSPSRKLESFCCTPSMIPCCRKVLSNLVCIISSLLWCKASILLRLIYNHNTHIWDSPRAKICPMPWEGNVRRFSFHSRHTPSPSSEQAHMAAVSCTSGALWHPMIVVELLSIPWLYFCVPRQSIICVTESILRRLTSDAFTFNVISICESREISLNVSYRGVVKRRRNSLIIINWCLLISASNYIFDGFVCAVFFSLRFLPLVLHYTFTSIWLSWQKSLPSFSARMSIPNVSHTITLEKMVHVFFIN